MMAVQTKGAINMKRRLSTTSVTTKNTPSAKISSDVVLPIHEDETDDYTEAGSSLIFHGPRVDSKRAK